jgi:HNH endonuclease
MATVPRTKPTYNNLRFYNRDGELIFRGGPRKADWYLSRNLAELIDGDPTRIRLLFETNGDGRAGDDFYLQDRENRCVVCGTDDHKVLTGHHIVPYSFRRWYPEELKSHSCFDILPVCTKCHDEYNPHEREFRLQLAKEYDAPLDGTYDRQKWLDYVRVRKDAYALIECGDQIPQDRKDFLLNRIKEITGEDNPDLKLLVETPFEQAPTISQGQMIVPQLTDIPAFNIRWRKHFVETMKPQYLPEYWDVERKER